MKSFDQEVRDWAASKPANETYDYWVGTMAGGKGCALCQFLFENGYAANPVVGRNCWNDGKYGEKHPYSFAFADALSQRPWTFGALAERLS